jgi:hypothetical protein
VSDEPWAYVAYHHGRWNWSLGLGWCWIPGVNYSPAWVAWNYTPGYCGWAPLGYYNTPCHWGYGAWGGGYAWNVVSINYLNTPNIRARIYSDVHIIRSFNGGDGGGDRDLRAPWRRSPLMVSNAEFRNPGQIQTAFRQDVHRERMVAYERQAQVTTGRTILRHDMTPPPNAGRRPEGSGSPARVPFENRGRIISSGHVLTPREGPMAPRPEERRPDPVPRDRPVEPRPRVDERRPDPALRERPMEPRPRPMEERRPDPVQQGRPVEPRPRVDERRPDPTPRERPMEPRPRPMEERRVDPPAPRDRGAEPRPRVDREERRPEPQPKAERESRPAPRKEEAPREHPKDEKHP